VFDHDPMQPQPANECEAAEPQVRFASTLGL
jgi:hypothetical protein